MNLFETRVHTLIKAYQTHIIEDGGKPINSEFVRRCLIRYGLPGAFQAYHRINKSRAHLQTEQLGIDDKKGIKIKLLTTLFEYIVTPIESGAALIGQGPAIQRFNKSLGAADWAGGIKFSNTPAVKYQGGGDRASSPKTWGENFDDNFGKRR